MAETTAINVVDLDTALDVLLPKPDLNGPWNLWDYIHPRIHKLNVVFRLPLAFCKALQEDEDLDLEASHAPSAVLTRYTTWKCLWLAICQLQQLRSLHIWLDHDHSSSWSVVKERLVLRRVIAILTAHMQASFKEKTMPLKTITFNLPKLHPRFARPETHFVQASPLPPPFTIERRYRQRYHWEEWADGRWRVKYESDFPIMHEWAHMAELSHMDESPDMTEWTMQEVEEFETRLWNEGTNVYQYMMEVMNDFQVSYF